MSGSARSAVTSATIWIGVVSWANPCERTRGAALARVVGCEAAMRAAETVSWPSTSAAVRPAFTRPTTVSQGVSSDGRDGHCGARARGIHACTPFELILAGVEGLHPVEARRRDADDGERRAAEQYRLTDGIVTAVEMGAPEVFRDDRHRRRGRAVVVTVQESPAQRRRAQDLEEIAGDEGAADRDGAMAPRRRHAQVAFRADPVERRIRRQIPHDRRSR